MRLYTWNLFWGFKFKMWIIFLIAFVKHIFLIINLLETQAKLFCYNKKLVVSQYYFSFNFFFKGFNLWCRLLPNFLRTISYNYNITCVILRIHNSKFNFEAIKLIRLFHLYLIFNECFCAFKTFLLSWESTKNLISFHLIKMISPFSNLKT